MTRRCSSQVTGCRGSDDRDDRLEHNRQDSTGPKYSIRGIHRNSWILRLGFGSKFDLSRMHNPLAKGFGCMRWVFVLHIFVSSHTSEAISGSDESNRAYLQPCKNMFLLQSKINLGLGAGNATKWRSRTASGAFLAHVQSTSGGEEKIAGKQSRMVQGLRLPYRGRVSRT